MKKPKEVWKSIKEIGKFFGDVYAEWDKDSPELLAAGLGYFMLFSLPPLLIIGSTALGFLFAGANPTLVMQKLEPLIGREATYSILGWLKLAAGENSGKATLISLVVLWLGASRVFTQLRSAMNIVWKVPTPQMGFWRSLMRQSMRKVAVVFGVAVFFMVVFTADTFVVALNKSFGGTSPILVFFWQTLSFFVSFFLLVLGVAGIYRYVPDTRIQWRDVWPGAVITAVMLAVGKTVISVYLGFQSITSAYGAAGSVIVIMIWIYFAAQIFLFGAKLTWMYAQRYGSKAKA